jgi:hypothetical protein
MLASRRHVTRLLATTAALAATGNLDSAAAADRRRTMDDSRKLHPKIVRIWRGRVRRDRADEYEAYSNDVGIAPLREKALAVQTFREDRANETEFMTVSYWSSVDAMSAFTGRSPTEIHHLPRDPEFLIELPKSVQILELRTRHVNDGVLL